MIHDNDIDSDIDIKLDKIKNIFSSNDYNYKTIKNNIKKIENLETILKKLCFIENENHIIINYPIFKILLKNGQYEEIIIQYIFNIMRGVLKIYPQFIIHINMDSLTLVDIDKYYSFITKISKIMRDSFPEKMYKCHIYNASFIFSKLFKIISLFIDKNTQKKINIL